MAAVNLDKITNSLIFSYINGKDKSLASVFKKSFPFVSISFYKLSLRTILCPFFTPGRGVFSAHAFLHVVDSHK